MSRRRLGHRDVGPVALGGARWSLVDTPDDAMAAATVEAALDAGVTLFDTARAYTPVGREAHNETLLGRLLRRPLAAGDVLVSTKGGHDRRHDGGFDIDGRPATLRRHCEASLAALSVDTVPVYSLHWPDPDVPLRESVGALAELRTEGKVGLVGLCNVDVGHIVDASAETRIDVVQNRYSVPTPGTAPDTEVVDHCTRHGIAFLGYSPFGGARTAPRLTEAVPRFAAVAEDRHCSVHRVVIAWLLAVSGAIPIVGAGRPDSIRDAVAGAELTLSAHEVDVLSASVGGAP